jgi:7,8-dihydro-6-hydroxymethylpterin-pyrophosphokinase
MKSQHQVILSIGSNLGNRLENIERSLELIHQEVGTIIKVSRLYETPAWGFESDAFTIVRWFCILFIGKMSSFKNRKAIVVCEIQEYQSRTIDIDLIAFDSEIIATEKLEIPHPLMQNRNFVLLPIQDLNLD